MPLLRSIIAILLLLSQAWPVQAAADAVPHGGCVAGCCAAAEQGTQGCDCQTEPAKPAPQQAPLPEGRGTLPQIARVEDGRADFLPKPALGEGMRAAEVCGKELRLRHVRMQVLLCAFLN